MRHSDRIVQDKLFISDHERYLLALEAETEKLCGKDKEGIKEKPSENGMENIYGMMTIIR